VKTKDGKILGVVSRNVALIKRGLEDFQEKDFPEGVVVRNIRGVSSFQKKPGIRRKIGFRI